MNREEYSDEVYEPEDRTARIARDEPVALEGQMADRVILELIRPIQIDGKERTELKFEEPTAFHIKRLEQASRGQMTAAMFRLVADCCSITPKDVEQLRSRDVSRIMAVAAYFLPEAPAAGATSGR